MSEIKNRKLVRQMGLVALTATGICSMLGASIYIVPFMIQRNVPDIGPYVLGAFAFAAIPALFAALAYAILSSAMPRAGGSYIYVSRGLNPFLGFIASFSQWFGLSIVIGVISYVIVPFIRDVAEGLELDKIADLLETGMVRVGFPLCLLWAFVWVNIRGAKSYERVLIPMMILMFGLGAIVIFAGFMHNQVDFINALESKGENFVIVEKIEFNWTIFFTAAALLFSSFIGFDSIAQAGGEAKNPTKNLPKAILLAILGVGCFYFLFTAAVYHTVPWSYVAAESLNKDLTAPGLLSYVLPSYLGIAIILGATIALINDLPAMLLSVSRLMFAWAEDGIFPSKIATVHPIRKTPLYALLIAGVMASIGILGSHFAGDFFLGVDIMVTAMLVNFLLICITLLVIPNVNPQLANDISIFKNRTLQLTIAWVGIVFLTGFLVIHTYKDIQSEVSAWYFHSTLIYLIVMTIGSTIFTYKWFQKRPDGKSIKDVFKTLPSE